MAEITDRDCKPMGELINFVTSNSKIDPSDHMLAPQCSEEVILCSKMAGEGKQFLVQLYKVIKPAEAIELADHYGQKPGMLAWFLNKERSGCFSKIKITKSESGNCSLYHSAECFSIGRGLSRSLLSVDIDCSLAESARTIAIEAENCMTPDEKNVR